MMRSRAWPWWLEGLAGSIVVMSATVGIARGADSPSNASKLMNLVVQDCGSCHGLTMKGGLGKPLTPDELAKWDRDQLTHIILDGVPGTPMPAWRSLLSEADAGWIADRLKQGQVK